MTKYSQPTVARREGQSYWDRLREIEAILARRASQTPKQRERLRAWLDTNPSSAKRRGR